MDGIYIADEELTYVFMGLDALLDADAYEAEYTQDEELKAELYKRIGAVEELYKTLKWRLEEVKCI